MERDSILCDVPMEAPVAVVNCPGIICIPDDPDRSEKKRERERNQASFSRHPSQGNTPQTWYRDITEWAVDGDLECVPADDDEDEDAVRLTTGALVLKALVTFAVMGATLGAGVVDADVVGEGVAELVGEAESEGVVDGDGDAEGVEGGVGDADGEAVGDTVGVVDGDCVVEGVADGDDVAEGVVDGNGVAEGEGGHK
jgi:hypothetical protein